MSKHIVVIGGGPGGMMAAIAAQNAGAQVTLIEKNEKLGKKLYITGKGRCNVTNASDTQGLIRSTPHNGRFLFSSFDGFTPQDLCALLEKNGCPTVTERGQRVFPASGKASDVTRALEKAMQGATILLNTKAASILTDKTKVTGVRLTNGKVLACDAVIIATGGLSYPSTGSTGDGYGFAENCGHTVTDTHPALVPVNLKDTWAKSLQGLPLKNVQLSAMAGKKRLFQEQGELLFTHFGISGPLVLSLSSYLVGANEEEISLFLDLKPALSTEKLLARLQREVEANPRQELHTLMQGYLPRAMAALFPDLCGIDSKKTIGTLPVSQRQAIAQTLKKLPLSYAGVRSFSEAVITSGGVSTKEINPSTMQSKLMEGLYFAGEVIDVDALTGGFNLQIAFSTGYKAGKSAATENTI
jgi:predicted Rossmann fold flavoprotein